MPCPNVSFRRIVRLLALLPLAAALSGCVAAVALPFVAGSMLYARDKLRVRAATPLPEADRAAVAALPGVELTDLHELPAPAGATPSAAPDRWQQFFDYALNESRTPVARGARRSALLAPGSQVGFPERRPCAAPRPAVVVDLDGGSSPFDPAAATAAPASVIRGLARLREAGLTVLWISQVPAARVVEVASALRTSGLDPAGEDQLLLLRTQADRKQTLREQANDDVCVLAIAGDRRGDFDELFDYLRNSAAAVGLYPMMGSGWFLVPELFAPPAARPSEPADPSAGPG